MAGNSSEDPFLRSRSGHERGDPFENMREQMERERDNFFRGSNQRDWQNEPNMSRHGFFNRPRTSFAGFPNSSNTLGPGMRVPRYVNDGPDDWDGFGAMPGGPDSSGLPHHPAFTSNSLGRPRKRSEGREEPVSSAGVKVNNQ